MKTIRKNIVKCAALLTALMISEPAYSEGNDAFARRMPGATELPAVPGEKIDHGGMVINPVPRELSKTDVKALGKEVTFQYKGKPDLKESAQELLQSSGAEMVKLTVDYGAKAAKKLGVEPTSGAYMLTITPKGVAITGYDRDGAYYGLQTLRQIMGSELVATNGYVPEMKIKDYPEINTRGIVEGFYGEPWSHDTRLSIIDYMGRNKMNCYVYGPKDDPYHRTPYWRQPYPEKEGRQIKELAEAAKRNHVDFVWAVHPGGDMRWDKADYDSLLMKFNGVYDLGVRSYAIFFDDIEGEGTKTENQVNLLNNLVRDFVKAKGDVKRFIVCPTDYTKGWANPSADGQLATYGRSLDKMIDVFYTGDCVCCDQTAEGLEFVDSRIQRPAMVWWNFPVTDYCRHLLMMGPAYGLDPTITSDIMAGILSNPMEHGIASSLAYYGVADYGWNPAGYNPMDNWERAIVDLMPTDPEALRTLCINCTDSERGYRRDESWEMPMIDLDNYTKEDYNKLYLQFSELATVPARLNAGCSEALLHEIAPWVEQAGALGNRLLGVLHLMKLKEMNAGGEIYRAAYEANLMTPEQKEAYKAHKVGSFKLQPFYERAMEKLRP